MVRSRRTTKVLLRLAVCQKDVALCCRCVQKLKSRVPKKNINPDAQGEDQSVQQAEPVSVQELSEAEVVILSLYNENHYLTFCHPVPSVSPE